MNAPDELKLLAAPANTPVANLLEQWTSYWLNATQRSVQFLDVLRERANNMLEHERNGLAPLLDFNYETILDARRFKHSLDLRLTRDSLTVRGHDAAAPPIALCVDGKVSEFVNGSTRVFRLSDKATAETAEDMP